MSLFIVDFKKILPSKYCFCVWCLDHKSNEHEVRNIKYLYILTLVSQCTSLAMHPYEQMFAVGFTNGVVCI